MRPVRLDAVRFVDKDADFLDVEPGYNGTTFLHAEWGENGDPRDGEFVFLVLTRRQTLRLAWTLIRFALRSRA